VAGKYEFSLEQIKIQREISMEQIKIQRCMMDSTRLQSEKTIMFTDPNTLHPPLRSWIMKKQYEILVRAGIDIAESNFTYS
jgi:hypothetical protein